jgi:hypothetical protein
MGKEFWRADRPLNPITHQPTPQLPMTLRACAARERHATFQALDWKHRSSSLTGRDSRGSGNNCCWTDRLSPANLGKWRSGSGSGGCKVIVVWYSTVVLWDEAANGKAKKENEEKADKPCHCDNCPSSCGFETQQSENHVSVDDGMIISRLWIIPRTASAALAFYQHECIIVV